MFRADKERKTARADPWRWTEQAASKGLSSSGGGKLASQLKSQKADGGRAEEAKRIAEDRAKGERLVVSSVSPSPSLESQLILYNYSGINDQNRRRSAVLYK